ncbi:MAG: hypothetical protein ABIZ57_01095 [Candidatus Limnocylindria bacterium]
MGQVYLAQDTQLDRVVALKILPTAVAADPQRLNRFLQEARAASKITGAHAAHIYEIGEASGLHFIAMECRGHAARATHGGAAAYPRRDRAHRGRGINEPR